MANDDRDIDLSLVFCKIQCGMDRHTLSSDTAVARGRAQVSVAAAVTEAASQRKPEGKRSNGADAAEQCLAEKQC